MHPGAVHRMARHDRSVLLSLISCNGPFDPASLSATDIRIGSFPLYLSPVVFLFGAAERQTLSTRYHHAGPHCAATVMTSGWLDAAHPKRNAPLSSQDINSERGGLSRTAPTSRSSMSSAGEWRVFAAGCRRHQTNPRPITSSAFEAPSF